MVFDFEKSAMKNEPCPKILDMADTCAYISLKYLYAMYRNGFISRKEATKEKRTIVYNHAKDKSMIEFVNRNALEKNEAIKSASKEYKENPTIENADKLYAAFYNLPDDWRHEKNEKEK